MAVPVTLSAPSTTPVTVTLTTVSGTATAGTDFVAKTQTLTFNPGVTSLTFTVSVKGDRLVEPNETFTVVVQGSPTGAVVADGTGVVTIQDNDARSSGPVAVRSVTAPRADLTVAAGEVVVPAPAEAPPPAVASAEAAPLVYPGGYVQESDVPVMRSPDLRRLWEARRPDAGRRAAGRPVPVPARPRWSRPGGPPLVVQVEPAPLASLPAVCPGSRPRS